MKGLSCSVSKDYLEKSVQDADIERFTGVLEMPERQREILYCLHPILAEYGEGYIPLSTTLLTLMQQMPLALSIEAEL